VTVAVNETQTLFARNAKVYLACRTQSRAEEAMNELRAAAPASTGELVFLQMDLSDLASVRRAAAEFLEYVAYAIVACTLD
jgi:retinol dehydrogenase-12